MVRKVEKSERHPGGRPRQQDYTPMGQAIDRLAGQRGLHLDEVAAKAEIALATLNRIMTGAIASPRVSTVVNISKALGASVSDLVSAG